MRLPRDDAALADAQRELSWEGCLNVRDLGGQPTEDGNETRFGVVVRADSVRRLSDRGWAALVAHGVRTIVDLRWQSELEADPPRELPVEVVHVPLLGVRHDAAELAFLRSATSQHQAYVGMLEGFGPGFALAVTAVAQAPEGGVLVHCQAGKDRTGLVVALLLRLAGVDAETIAADYALSGARLADVLERWIAEGADEEERAHRRLTSETPAEAMLEVLAELERRNGSVREYLLAAGAQPDDLDRVRARLRG